MVMTERENSIQLIPGFNDDPKNEGLYGLQFFVEKDDPDRFVNVFDDITVRNHLYVPDDVFDLVEAVRNDEC